LKGAISAWKIDAAWKAEVLKRHYYLFVAEENLRRDALEGGKPCGSILIFGGGFPDVPCSSKGKGKSLGHWK